ncbi:MAG: carboxyltransferase subunit alpha [Terriglobia bacterium]
MFRRKELAGRKVGCTGCGADHPVAELEGELFICPDCQHYLPMPSWARVASLADPESFREMDRKLVSVDPLKFADRKSYRERLKQARSESGVREAVTTGTARITSQRAILIVFDFDFLGGTMGSVVGEKIARAFETATKSGIPVVSITASGGARVQEGMLSLMQMAKVSAAVSLHHREGLAFISVLTDPTFGGVSASFASLGDVLIAEPGAQIGFTGPRVIEQTTGFPPPEGSHQAETLLREGFIDLVSPRKDLREVLGYLVTHLRPEKAGRVEPERAESPRKATKLPAWDEVGLARHPARPTAQQLCALITSRFLELHGDRQRGDDPAVIGGLAELDGQTVIMIGQQRSSASDLRESPHRGMTYPEGYRKSLRLMQLAAKFKIPVVTLVDCPAVQVGYESEQRGIAQALAHNLAGMASLPTPIISVIIGEGGSGGALALAIGDRVLMLEHAVYSVISPEGAAAIIYRDAAKAKIIAEKLRLTADDLLSLGIIDGVVPEPEGGAHLDPAAAAAALKSHILSALGPVRRLSAKRLLVQRYEKYRHIGRVGVFWREVVRTEVLDGMDAIARAFPREAAPMQEP